MTKIETLLASLPEAPFKEQLKGEITTIRAEKDELIKAIADHQTVRSELRAENERLKDQLESTETCGKLMDAWIAEHGSQIPWPKAVQLLAIVMKYSDEERDRLLCLDYPDYPAQVTELTRQRDEAMQDAEKWRHYQKRKQEVIEAGMGRKILRDAAIKESKP